ncbi:MAG: transcriptional activator NhaR [Myxococcota bacterium]
MHDLNYHHLRYFWTVAREGGLAPASRVLRVAHPTISTQIRQLEEFLGEDLFDRSGRRLILTDVGKRAFQYADEIFALGSELVDGVRGGGQGRNLRLHVGATDVVPKLLVRRLIEIALAMEPPPRVQVVDGQHEQLLASLATHDLDIVIADVPVTPNSGVRAYNHLLGESGVSFFATPDLAETLQGAFPKRLDQAPFLMPTTATALRLSLEKWFDQHGIAVHVVAEIEDSALLKAFGGDGIGAFAVPSIVEDSVVAAYHAVVLGRTTDITERFYAITADRRLKHPAVVTICETAREQFFRGS